MIDTPLTNALWLSLYLLTLVAVVARADVRHELIAEDRVERIEKNTVYDIRINDHGEATLEHRLTQLIFHDVTRPDTFGNEKRVIVDWRMMPTERILRFSDHRGKYILWDDKGTLRRVRYRTWGESVTDYDPEVFAQEELARDRRRGIR